MADKDQQKRKKGGGRTTGLAMLLAVVAVIAAWLSNCIPGFGIGDGSKDGEGEAAKQETQEQPEAKLEPEAEAEPESEPEPAAKPAPLKLTIDPRGCSVDGGEPIDCATLCDEAERFEGREAVVIDAKNGPAKSLGEATDCIKSKGLDVAIEDE